MKKQLLIATIGVLTVGALIAGTSSVFAVGETNTDQQTLVQKIADRFSLKESDVQAVFDESRQERRVAMQATMTAALENRLNQAVINGKITTAQKQLILEKHQQMQAQREDDMADWQNKTPEERKTAMEARRTELETWAKDNNIDFSYVAGGRGGMMGRGDGMGMGGGRHGMMGEDRDDN